MIDHLNRINICHTYWVKTSGMITEDFKQLADKFLAVNPQSNNNET